MRRPALFLFLFSAITVSARQGSVETRDGKFFDGHIRFESNRVIIVNPDTLLCAQVQLTNLLATTLKRSAPEQAGVWSGGQFHGPLDDSRAGPRWNVADGVPHPWREEAIGRTGHPGSATFTAGLFRIHSSGARILSSSDSFHFVYKPVRGNSEIIARVIQVQPTDPWAKAGLMLRESLEEDAPNVMLAVTAGRGGLFQWRAARGEETKGTIRRDLSVPCWIKLRREGDTITGYKSNDGRTWGVVEKTILPLSQDIYAGLAAVGPPGPRLHRSALDNVQEGLSLPSTSFVPQVELQGGSTIAGQIESADDDGVRFVGRAWQAPLSLYPVANIRFQFVPTRFAGKLKTGRAGVLLAGGDFIDGEFKGIQEGQVIVSSTVLGLKSYDIHRDVIAVILRKQTASPADYEVKTEQGSVWLGRRLELTDELVILRETTLGVCRIPLHELAELRRRN